MRTGKLCSSCRREPRGDWVRCRWQLSLLGAPEALRRSPAPPAAAAAACESRGSRSPLPHPRTGRPAPPPRRPAVTGWLPSPSCTSCAGSLSCSWRVASRVEVVPPGLQWPTSGTAVPHPTPHPLYSSSWQRTRQTHTTDHKRMESAGQSQLWSPLHA